MNGASQFTRARAEMADGMARICRLYGVSPQLGRLYTELLLSTTPLTLDELCTRVGAAKSSVSVALRALERAKVARRLPPRSDRRDAYEGITDPWAIFSDWTTLYFTPELDMFRVTGAKVRDAMNAPDAPTGEEAARIRERLDAFADFGEVLGAMLESVNGAGAANATPASRRIPIEVPR